MNATFMNQPKSLVTELTVGRNYGDVFGLNKETQAMIYNGGISWTAKENSREMTMECQKTTDKVLAYINK